MLSTAEAMDYLYDQRDVLFQGQLILIIRSQVLILFQGQIPFQDRILSQGQIPFQDQIPFLSLEDKLVLIRWLITENSFGASLSITNQLLT